MSQPDVKDYPLSLSDLQPNRKVIGELDYDAMLVEIQSYKESIPFFSTGIPLSFNQAMLSIVFPATLDRETLVASLQELNPRIASVRGQILDHDHAICPIDHLYLSGHGDLSFSPELCIGAAIFHSEGNPNGLILNDILILDERHNLPYPADDLVYLDRSLYEDVFRPLAARHGGTFVLFSSH